MSTQYIDYTVDEQWLLDRQGKCVFCGECNGDKCFSRECTSCAQYWRSPVGKYLDDGRPAKEYCYDCKIYNEVADYLKASHEQGETELTAFCFECECCEVFDGLVSGFAEKLLKLGWVGCPCKVGEIVCGDCRDKQPVANGFWEQADYAYAEWKLNNNR